MFPATTVSGTPIQLDYERRKLRLKMFLKVVARFGRGTIGLE
jgi:hypothetical protein